MKRGKVKKKQEKSMLMRDFLYKNYRLLLSTLTIPSLAESFERGFREFKNNLMKNIYLN